MKFNTTACFGLALAAILLFGTSTRAETISFLTSGTFTGGETPDSSTYTDNGVVIQYNPSFFEVEAPPESTVNFGTLNSGGTNSDLDDFEGVSSGFVLEIFQIEPEAGDLTFLAELQGQLRFDDSQAFLLFDGPLTQSLGLVIYSITEADRGIPGRVDIPAPSSDNPTTSIEGTVTFIPEPSALALVALGAPVPFVLMLRNRKHRQATA